MPQTNVHRSLVNEKLLRFLSILFAMGGIGLLSAALFNFQPYIRVVSDWYNFLDFRHGIPVEAKANLDVSDTSFVKYIQDSSSRVGVEPTVLDETKLIQNKKPMIEGTDSIFAQKNFLTKQGEVIKDVNVSGMQINRAKLYLQTDKLSYRLYFSFPGILICLAASYCFWLLAGLVSDIQAGLSFGKINRQRLQKMGWVVLTVQVIFLITDLFAPVFGMFEISFTNTIYNFRSPFHFYADPVIPFSATWTLIGILLLVLASAFRDGEMLQEDKDLIV